MPNRFIKESICTSDTIDQLSWFDEVVFYRLIVNCDDFGRFDGRGEIIKSRLFPLKDGKITVKSVVESINRLATVGLVILYERDGRPYLQLSTWDKHQQTRATKSKYPAFDGTCKQLISSDNECPRIRIRDSNSISEKRDAREDALAGFDGELRLKLEEWLHYKQERREGYKPTGLRNLVSEIKNKRSVYSDAQICALISECMANGWRGIIWDKLKSPPKSNKSAQTGNQSSLDMDRIHRAFHGGGE